MKPLIIIIIALSTGLSCKSHTNIKPPKNTKQNLYNTLNNHFHFLDSIRHYDTADLMETENKKVAQSIDFYKQDIINSNDTIDFDFIYVAKSIDKNFCLVSWDTRMGGTMIDFATVAIYKTNTGLLLSKRITDTTENAIDENTLMHYNRIFSIETNSGKIYLGQGFGQGSTALPWQELRAFKIENNKLENPRIFPKKEFRLSAEFDTHQFSKNENIPTIKVIDNGKTILLPITTDKEGFSGKYQTLFFTGTLYKIK